MPSGLAAAAREPVRASPGRAPAELGVQPAHLEGSLPRAHVTSQALRERAGSVQRIRCRPCLPPPSLHKLPALLPSPGIHRVIPRHRLCGALPPVLPVPLRRGIPRLERRRPRHPQLLLAATVRQQDDKMTRRLPRRLPTVSYNNGRGSGGCWLLTASILSALGMTRFFLACATSRRFSSVAACFCTCRCCSFAHVTVAFPSCDPT